ncbi:MAG: TetR/AcrR family transcriptional regulator [Desulfomonilaceae bacterium]
MNKKTKQLPQDILLGAKNSNGTPIPPGGIKIMQALRSLLQEKNFESITTAEISRLSGVNEALIYRYFGDKRGLLHKILAEYFSAHLAEIEQDVHSSEGSLEKLKTLIRGTISFHKKNNVFSRILLLEVRNHPTYFQSEAYDLAKKYFRLINQIIEQGIKNGEIRQDLPLSCMRDIIIGSIERACMRPAVFDLDFDEEALAGNLAEAVIGGISMPTDYRQPCQK